MRFDHVDWGYVEQEDGWEIDTVNFESYTININEKGVISRK